MCVLNDVSGSGFDMLLCDLSAVRHAGRYYASARRVRSCQSNLYLLEHDDNRGCPIYEVMGDLCRPCF
jgi:hypothetical protein